MKIARTLLYERVTRESVIPADEYLEITVLPFKMTKAMMTETAYYAQNQASFKSASEMLFRGKGIEIDYETVRKTAEYVGNIIHNADILRSTAAYESVSEIDYSSVRKGTLYIMTDGAMVNTRAKDENGSTWRENKLALIFTDRDMLKTKGGNNIILKKEYVSYVGSSEEFKKHIFEAAVRNGYGTYENVVVIGDGASWIRTVCHELFPDAVQILDKYHLIENIYAYAKPLFNNVETEYVKWAETVIDKVEKGLIDEVFDIISNSGEKPDNTVNLESYLRNNIDKIKYVYYEQKGWFVGSGAIESGNKIVLQRRLKQPGMRWNVNSAQSILSLRAKAESNLWVSHVHSLICS